MKSCDYSNKQNRYRIYKKARRLVKDDWSCYHAIMEVTGLNGDEVRQHFTELRQSYQDVPVDGNYSKKERLNACIEESKPESLFTRIKKWLA